MFQKRLFIVLSSVVFFLSCHKKIDTVTNENPAKNILEWHLPELSVDEKKGLVQSVQTVFTDLYVNRLQKYEEFQFDSKEAVKNLNESMESELLLKNIMNIFMQSRDLHTTFEYPYPVRCLVGFFPLEAALIYDDINDVEGSTRNKRSAPSITACAA